MKKKKEISLPMKFNPGTMKYEPVLPARKAKKHEKIDIKIKWFWIILLILIIILLIFIFIK
jgi:uncharacterized integral membrane protein